MNIKVIGAGVSGLSTAISLQEAGYQVEIIADKMPAATVSSVAAAIWLPFNLSPQELVNQWALESYSVFEQMSKNPSTGVSMVELEVWVDQSPPSWTSALPPNLLSPIQEKIAPIGTGNGFQLKVPLIESPIYMPYLLDRYKAGGGKINLQKVNTLEDLSQTADFVVNCSGLAAKKLAQDAEMFPIRGQLVKLQPQSTNPMIIDFIIPQTEDQLFYIIPRQDALVIGGSAKVGDYDQEIKPEESQAILERLKAYAPQLAQAKLVGEEVGLRPGRKSVRLEKEGNIIHNYGHGGGGYTVSWGCARAVLKLLKK